MTSHTSRLSRTLLLVAIAVLPALTVSSASAKPMMGGKMMKSHKMPMRMKGMTMAQSNMMRMMMSGMSATDKRAMMGMSMSEKRAMMNSMKMHGKM